jgi:hypothetical protein
MAKVLAAVSQHEAANTATARRSDLEFIASCN